MTPEEQDALQYRFAGYQLPMIQLDSTGPSYVVLDVHPYYRNQPLYWQKNAYKGSTLGTTEIVGGNTPMESKGSNAMGGGNEIKLIDL